MQHNKKKLHKRIWAHRYMFLFLLPGIIWYLVFCYYPMYGILMAFKKVGYTSNIWTSDWVGFKYFIRFFTHHDFWNITRNTVVISGLKLIIGFPMPIILALMLNEIRNVKFKKTVQTMSYLPHFVSWVIVIALFNKIFTPYAGLVNELRAALFGKEPVYFMGSKVWFYPIMLFMHVWKAAGWGSIIYLAALAGVDVALYEAASIDGCGRFRKIWHISLPCIKGTMGILFILSVGSIMKAGFDQIYLMQNPAVLEISEIIDTYVLKMGIRKGHFSYATAIGLFQSVISFGLVIITNKVSKKVADVSLW